MAKGFRCISEPVRLHRVAAQLQKKFSGGCDSSYCAAEKKHVRADMAEAEKYIRAGKCDAASIVIDHLELIARKRS